MRWGGGGRGDGGRGEGGGGRETQLNVIHVAADSNLKQPK